MRTHDNANFAIVLLAPAAAMVIGMLTGAIDVFGILFLSLIAGVGGLLVNAFKQNQKDEEVMRLINELRNKIEALK